MICTSKGFPYIHKCCRLMLSTPHQCFFVCNTLDSLLHLGWNDFCQSHRLEWLVSSRYKSHCACRALSSIFSAAKSDILIHGFVISLRTHSSKLPAIRYYCSGTANFIIILKGAEMLGAEIPSSPFALSISIISGADL